MSFSFNFSIDSGVNDANCIDTDINVSDEGHNVVQHQHFISDLTIPAIVVPAPLSNAADVHEFSIIPILNSSISIITNASVSSEPENSDLVECVYGGGKKVWECSVDLAIFLNENRHDLQLNSSSRVLELGCGHGIPGMVLLQLGYKVTFTDLNADVLERVTWPNIFKNCPSNSNHAACIAGDWRNVSSELERDRFDLIVSAETLYSPLSCQLVADFLAAHLSENGCALLGTKRFYFGVNGGTYELERIINEIYSSSLSLETVKEYVDGCSNIRDLLRVSKQRS